MKTCITWGTLLLVFAVLVGCNEAPPMTKTVDRNVEVSPPGTAFKLSPNAADEKRESEIPIAEDPPMEEETMASEPRRKTVFESLFQAVRNGAAEALDGEGTSPQR
jgi:hypothetical protein